MDLAGEVRRADQEIRDGGLIPSAGQAGPEWGFSKNLTATFAGSAVNYRTLGRVRVSANSALRLLTFLDLSFQVRDGSPDWTEVDRTAS